MFDPAKRLAVLNPVGRSHAMPTIPQTPVSAALSSNNIEAFTSLIKVVSGLMNHTPQTPICNASTHELAINSPNVPTPSQLT
jgi:hypothetical protein